MIGNELVDLLIVEDNSNDMELTLRSLKKNNLANPVHVVKDGAEALDFIFAQSVYAARAGAKKPKVIFLDLKLPKISGIDVLRTLKSDERTKMIPVVVLTSSQQERDVLECYHLGVNSYVVKPVDFTQFAQAIAHVGLYWLAVNQPPAPDPA